MSENQGQEKRRETAIRYGIGNAAQTLISGGSLTPEAQKFVAEFTELADTSGALLLPQALSRAIVAAFEGTGLAVWPEARFTVPGTHDPSTAVPKSMDFVITSKAGTMECRGVAIEVKATMEFNSLAAALMEIAMMTERSEVSLRPRGAASFNISTANLRCLTLSCNDNQHIAPLLHVMSRQLWPDNKRKVVHHRLFLESKKVGTPRLTASLGVQDFLNDIFDWCQCRDSE